MAQQPITGIASPPSKETSDLHFKLITRNDTFPFRGQPPPTYANLVAVANSYGISFIGTIDAFLVVQTNSLENDNYPRKEIRLRGRPTHLSVSCDESLLAVGYLSSSGPAVAIFTLASLTTSVDLLLLNEVRLPATASSVICDLVWNPAVPNLLSACLSDGSLVVLEFKGSAFELYSLPSAASARCLCWSPKGKQIVVGGEDGKLTQYRPDLKPAKAIPAPPLFNGAVAVLNVLWVSNFQFAAFYRNRQSAEDPPVFVIMNATKNEPMTFVNYDDITYGMPGFRCPQIYFLHLTHWNLILVGSANAVDIAVLHLGSDGKTWEQWTVGDSSRAELPLSVSQGETFPVGMTVDFSSQSPVPWPQTGSELPPSPRLLLLSNEGRICLFHVLFHNAPSINMPVTRVVPAHYFNSPQSIQERTAKTPLKDSNQQIKPPVQDAQVVAENSPFVPQQPTATIFAPAKYLQVAADQPSISDGSKISKTPSAQGASPAVRKGDPVEPPAKQMPSAQVTPLPPQTTPSPVQATPSPPAEDDPITEPVVDDSVYEAAIADEVHALQEELDAVLHEESTLNLDLGSEVIFREPVQRVETLLDFNKEVEDTTVSQAEEVAELKLEVLELLARAEEARLLVTRRSSSLASQVRRSEQLDPVTSRTLRDILALRVFIENQLRQVREHLDKQWEEYQLKCRKDAKNRLETPMMDDVVKTIDLQKKLVSRLNAEIGNLKKAAALKADSGIWTQKMNLLVDQQSNRCNELSKLADNLLGMKIGSKAKDSDGVLELVLKSKRQHSGSTDLRSSDLNLLFDRFEDADVPEVSHALSFSEREAHKKHILTRLKVAAAAKQKKKEQLSPVPLTPNAISPAFNKPHSFIKSPSVPQPLTSGFEKTTATNAPIVNLSKSSKTFGPVSNPNILLTNTPNPTVASSTKQTTSAPFSSFSAPNLAVRSSNSTIFGSTKNKSNAISPLVTPSSTLTTTKSNIFGSSGFGGFSSSPSSGFFSSVIVASPHDDASTLSSTDLKLSSSEKTAFGPPIKPMSTTPSVSNTKTTTISSLSSTPITTTNASVSSAFASTSLSTSSFGSSSSPLFGGTVLSAIPDKTTSVLNIFGASKVPEPPTEKKIGPGIFGSLVISEATSDPKSGQNLFAAPEVSKNVTDTTKIEQGLFGIPKVSGSPTVTTIFGTVKPADIVTGSNVFGSAKTAEGPTATNIFGTSKPTDSSTTPNVFGTLKPNDGSTAPNIGLFGTSKPAEVSSGSSIFSTVKPTDGTTAPNIFGTPKPADGSTGSNVFGTPTSTTPSTPSDTKTTVDNSATSAISVKPTSSLQISAPQSQPLTTTFAASNESLVTASSEIPISIPTPISRTISSISSVFGTPAASTTSVFGTSASTISSFQSPASSDSPNNFSSPTPGIFAAAASGRFGSPTSVPSTTATGFGFGGQTPTTAGTGLFGSFPTSAGSPSGASIFGGGFTAPAPTAFGSDVSQTTNLFGQMLGGSTTPTTTPANIFSQVTPSQFNTGGSIFGTAPASTSQSVFGTPPSNIFGQSSFGSPTSSAPIFGQTATTTSDNTFFGQSICSPFGTGTAAPNQSPFGSPTAVTTQNAFGGSTFSKPLFGQSVFNESGNNSVFGGNTSGGSASIFGGSSGGSVFQSTPGPFSSNTGVSVAQSGFGTSNSFNKPAGGFGSAPSFGGVPATGSFGAAPAFNGSPGFGDNTAFGSQPKVFGSPSAQSAPVFESLAGQNTVGFGSLAQSSQGFGSFTSTPQPTFGTQQQQQQQQQQQPPPTFGGSSFSSWR